MKFKTTRYFVRPSIGWGIFDSKLPEASIIEVTSEGYAFFLCELLNSGATLQEVKERKCPDTVYFDALATMYTD